MPEGALRLKDDLARAGFDLGALFSHKETYTQAFLAISGSGFEVRPFGDEEVAILSFRGTGTMKDWLSNVKLLQIESEGTEVH